LVDQWASRIEARSTDRAPHRKQRGAKTLDLSAATLTLQRLGAAKFLELFLKDKGVEPVLPAK
jgi:hypothetical protein